jgi:hypothetical protein
MAWTAPMTAVANAVFTAAQFNAHVRDNFLETAPAKATTAGGYFVSTGTNAIAERQASKATVATACTRTANAYAAPDSGSAGPAVTVTTGTQAIVHLKAGAWNSTAESNIASMGFAISGATTVAADDAYAITIRNSGTCTGNRFGGTFLVTGLTAGSNTFTAQYRSSSGTSDFENRDIIVQPL